MAMIDRYMEEQDLKMEIDELKSEISRLKAELSSAHETAIKYKEKWEALNRENTMLQNEQHRLMRQISQLKWETNNVIVSVPPSEQERFIAQMAEQLRQAEKATQNIVDDLKKQILSHMEIMPENKRYEFLVTCCNIFGNVSVMNKIIPELKNYLKESNKKETKTQMQINIDNSKTTQTYDVSGERAEVYPNVSKITHNWNK